MLKKVKEMVAKTLETYPQSRDDDFILVAIIYREYFGVTDKVSFFEIMFSHKYRNLPSFESIRRSRQKLQAEMPLIYGASGSMRKLRGEMENEYRKEFANG